MKQTTLLVCMVMETGAYNINMVMDTGAYNLNMVQQHKKNLKCCVHGDEKQAQESDCHAH